MWEKLWLMAKMFRRLKNNLEERALIPKHVFSWAQLSAIIRLVPTKITFPYQFKTTKDITIPDSVIYLDVVTSFGLRRIGFLVDSGSDTVVLPLSPYHFWFNFKPDQRKVVTLGGVEGKGVEAYPSKIKLQIGEEKFTVHCYFAKSNTMPLLSRLDIWDKFNWIFDNNKMQVIFERI